MGTPSKTVAVVLQLELMFLVREFEISAAVCVFIIAQEMYVSVIFCRQQNTQHWRHSKGPALSIEISLL